MLDFETTFPWMYGLVTVVTLALLIFLTRAILRRRAASRREESMLRIRRREEEIWKALESERTASAEDQTRSKDAAPPAL